MDFHENRHETVNIGQRTYMASVIYTLIVRLLDYDFPVNENTRNWL